GFAAPSSTSLRSKRWQMRDSEIGQLADHYLGRSARLDAVLLKGRFDSSPQLACDPILFARTDLDQHQVVYFVAVHAFDPRDLRFGNHIVFESGVVIDVRRYLLQQSDDAVAVFAVVGGDVERHLRPVARSVAHNLDGAVRYDVKRAVGVTQSGAAHGDL